PGAIVGTPHYLAPEVIRGGRADARSDIWALGALLYEMATGERPFRGPTPMAVLGAVLHELPTPLPEHIPPGLRLVIDRCLAKDPNRRYARAEEVRAALEALGGGRGSLPKEQGLGGIKKRSIRAALALLALVVLGWVGWRLWHGLSGPAPSPVQTQITN